MESRWTQTREYLSSLTDSGGPWPRSNVEKLTDPNYFVTNALAAVQERIQKLIWSKPQNVFNVTLAPHWSAAYCEWPDYCDCGTQGTTKIGHYQVDGEFVPRKGYEDVIPLVRPTLAQLASKRREGESQ